jgi:Tfp pilus assembly protein PilF
MGVVGWGGEVVRSADMAMSERMQKLRAMLEKAPEDTFLLYAIALEHRKAGQMPEALEQLGKVLAKDPTYCVAYQMMGQIHEQAGELDAARAAYQAGIEVADRKGDHHARDEMRGAMMLL